MHAVMIFGSVLASGTSDPGVLYASSCRATPMVLVLSFLALAFTLLDMGLMMLTFLYLRREDGRRLWVPIAVHAAAAASVRAVCCLLWLCGGGAAEKRVRSSHTPTPQQTLFNRLSNGCTVALPLVFVVTAGAGVLAAKERRRAASQGSL